MRWRVMPSLLTYHTYLMRGIPTSTFGSFWKDLNIEHIKCLIKSIFDVVERNKIPNIKNLSCLEQKLLLLGLMLKSFSSKDSSELIFYLLELIRKYELCEIIIPEALIIMGLMLHNLDVKEKNVLKEKAINCLWKYRQHNYWKIRASFGLHLSYAYFGEDEFLADILDLFKNEPNPYAKVVLCWYPIIATVGKKNQVWLDLCKSEDSFTRDLAVLALGFSFIESENMDITSALKKVIHNEKHIYPKESALYSIGIINLGSSNKDVKEYLDCIEKKEKGIVQSAATIAKCLLYHNTTHKDCLDMDNNKISWSHLVGLSFLNDSKNFDTKIVKKNDPEYIWGLELFYYFVGHFIDIPQYVNEYKELYLFQIKINEIMMKIWDSKLKRIFFLPVYFYFLYESFWWPLFILSYLSLYLEQKGEGKK